MELCQREGKRPLTPSLLKTATSKGQKSAHFLIQIDRLNQNQYDAASSVLDCFLVSDLCVCFYFRNHPQSSGSFSLYQHGTGFLCEKTFNVRCYISPSTLNRHISVTIICLSCWNIPRKSHEMPFLCGCHRVSGCKELK